MKQSIVMERTVLIQLLTQLGFAMERMILIVLILHRILQIFVMALTVLIQL